MASSGAGTGGSLPFFADATLDLAEAHDIADTPEATRPQFDTYTIQANRKQLQIPSLLLNSTSGGLGEITEETPSCAASPINERHIAVVHRSLSSPPELMWTPALSTESTASSAPHDTAARGEEAENDNGLNFTRISMDVDNRIPSLKNLRKPRWPRDITWTVTFLLTVPITLLYPIWHRKKDMQYRSPLAKHPLSFATLHAITWTVIAVVVLMRYLYRSVPGGEGDAARGQAAQMMATSAPCSVAVYATLTITVLVQCPQAAWAALVPAAYMMRDVYAFRRWTRRTDYVGAGYASRIAFFKAMVEMALDIISRSLRRASFVRGLSTILLVQLAVLLLWRAALLASLSWISSSGSLGPLSVLILLATWAAGKWATATTMRMLTLLASAGVMNWCSEQGLLLSELAPIPNGSKPSSSSRYRDGDNDDCENDGEYDDGDAEDDTEDKIHSFDNDANYNIPEAYRTVDASVYQSVIDVDDVLDDDDDDLDEEVLRDSTNEPDRRRYATGPQSSRQQRRNSHLMSSGVNGASQHPRSTVKSILWTGLTINFGGVAHCGLWGGLAQFVWSQLRRVEAAQTAIHASAATNGGRSGRFQGMAIGGSSGSAAGMEAIWSRINAYSRRFVREHSDLAMTHVGAYYKGYARAARDVATIIDQSGMEPILHEDITTHMCTCIGGWIAGLIVIITTYLLLEQKGSHEEVTDIHVVMDMLISFMLSYTLIFTVLEPLRAAVKASYVAFAQNPRCLSQAYPLIYHRLCRLSESSLS